MPSGAGAAQAVAATLLWASNADGAEAERLALAALEMPAEPDDLFAAAARGVISLVAEARGDVARALELATEVEATFRRRGDRWHALVSSICVSRILATSGRPDPERTARNLTEARLGGRYLLAVALVDAGLLALRDGESRAARAALHGGAGRRRRDRQSDRACARADGAGRGRAGGGRRRPRGDAARRRRRDPQVDRL